MSAPGKVIVVQWVPEEEGLYKMAMRVVVSTHPRFTIGTRFDFGFFNIATEAGYLIVSIPLEAKGRQ